jgi:DNA-directed RNA polymerase specialized sigma24 family protein
LPQSGQSGRIDAAIAPRASTFESMNAAAATGEVEQRALDLAFRITGSEADAAEAVERGLLEATERLSRLPEGEQSFARCLFGAVRDACHESMPRRQRPTAGEAMRGAIDAGQEAVAAASMRLPVRQREALALHELGPLSYEEVAAIMETSSGAVAQLISRARINLSDELHGTAIASIAAPSPECERALPLIAMRDDGQLDPGSGDAAWLDLHLDVCERCRRGVAAMQEAAASYRSWGPNAAPPTRQRRSAQRRPLLVAGLAAALVLAGLTAVLARDDRARPPLEPADAALAPGAAASGADGDGSATGATGKARKGTAAKRKARAKTMTSSEPSASGEVAAPATTFAPVQAPPEEDGGGEPTSRPGRSPGAAAVEPTQRTSSAKPSPKPQAATTTTTPAPAPTTVPETTTEEPPPVDESPSRRREPPGRPADRPPK